MGTYRQLIEFELQLEPQYVVGEVGITIPLLICQKADLELMQQCPIQVVATLPKHRRLSCQGRGQRFRLTNFGQCKQFGDLSKR